MTVETFITVHTVDLINDCENSGKFAELNHTYLFVGPKSVDEMPNVKHVVCRNYDPNYEQFPHFYDFTGWFVLAKHKLLTTDNIICLQYDHVVTDPELEKKVEDLLLVQPSVVGFVEGGFDCWWLNYTGFEQAFIDACAACGMNWPSLHYGRDFERFISTQGTAWNAEYFTKFMLWIEPAFEVLKDNLYCGHLVERMLQAFTMATTPYQTLYGATAHYAADSHGTGAWMRGDMDVFNARYAVFGK